jgi:hypothetical protein
LLVVVVDVPQALSIPSEAMAAIDKNPTVRLCMPASSIWGNRIL